ncbi:MAG: SCP2 sterol-binding domain-containing protein [Oscillospiraceae bacterium]|nr:SCP2 sterol-binding domain-containing protein [Oscillospiraceae bacterium]
MSFESTVKKVQKAYFADATVDASGYANFGVTVNIEDGKNDGKFFIAVTDGQFRVEPYAYDDRLCELKLTATVLNSVISGKTTIPSAIEKGKITCEGSLEGAELVQKLISSAVPAVKAAEVKTEKPAAKKSSKKAEEKPAAKKTEEKPAAKKAEEKPTAKKAEEKPAASKAEELKAEAPKTEAPKTEVKTEAPAKKAAKPRTRQKRK